VVGSTFACCEVECCVRRTGELAEEQECCQPLRRTSCRRGGGCGGGCARIPLKRPLVAAAGDAAACWCQRLVAA
jgi:hypothetical protein